LASLFNREAYLREYLHRARMFSTTQPEGNENVVAMDASRSPEK
jgi:hypothetical protein